MPIYGTCAPATEFARQCSARGITTAWIAKVCLRTEGAAMAWRQGWRTPGMAHRRLLAAALKRRYGWQVTPADLLVLMAQAPLKTPIKL